ncbi:SIR2 [Candida jiufengensis]|uniref:SIR2 n=1 Tax=Candida jiufengensis TaxID=497108 RepID=UPI002224F431|nr:SIR2 [Candida jiufengensis]KAI5951017.1 SIR2 [Candida jiufengensis]
MSDVILIDSDSEAEIPPSKKFKPNPTSEPYIKSRNGISIKPFNDITSSSSSNEEELDSSDSNDGIIILTESNPNKVKNNYDHNNNNKNQKNNNNYENNKNGKNNSHSTTELNLDISKQIFHQDSDSESAMSSSEEDDNDHIDIINAINPEDIEPTRQFLRQHGSMEFLETYLPAAASCQDIVNLILQLGFIPKNIKELVKESNLTKEENMIEYVNILHQAMMKIKSIRQRKEDVKTYKDVVELIKKSNKILVVTGAGISTSLGIPDFRSSKGFYSMIENMGLNDPQEVFDLDLFKLDPSIFYSIADKILPPGKIFSPLHSFIYLLQQKNKLLRNYTQNIDNLESYAGIKNEKLIQCHGSFANATCLTCGDKIPGEKIFPQIRSKKIPYCKKCNIKKQQMLKKNDDCDISESFGVYKPDITFFGEPLPERFHDHVNIDLQNCDLLISIGTSLKVAPVADIVEKIPQNIPQILINKDSINHCQFDVSLLGFCDDIASFLCNELGDDWKLPHKDYDNIRGPNGDYLKVELVNDESREYHIESTKRVAKAEELDSGKNIIEDGDNDEESDDGIEIIRCSNLKKVDPPVSI